MEEVSEEEIAFVHQTKYQEWVIVTQDIDEYDSIYLRLLSFRRKKLYKVMPMYLVCRGNTMKIMDIKVLNNDVNKGYGSVLMKEMFRIVNERNIEKITGIAERPDDERLIYFYKKHGFSLNGSKLLWERTN
ncbi:GNAT family N-acetyltransferase [Metabacillus fastidiosus]|uniref:GNAT family N-acetyltransferase n=1 Tax=Metabacillus fastidiosus TaxID=1458 RepID=UPI003D2BF3CD